MNLRDTPREPFLNLTASALSVPEHVYQDAVRKYEDVGDWLADERSGLRGFQPRVYVQGSFRLGTAVRPLTDKGEYDIDLVCALEIPKENTTQAELKNRVGARLQEREDLAAMLEERRRCWRLDYESEAAVPAFHVDVLPAIPNRRLSETAILLSDKDLHRWQQSDPKAYAEWFFNKLEPVLSEARDALAKSRNVDVEEVQDWELGTPLQVAIQLLKRHRDVYFESMPDEKPVSIIITTLAAQAYRGETDLAITVNNICQEILMKWGNPPFPHKRDDLWWVASPVDAGENFADKWNEHPERGQAFQKWITEAADDFERINLATDPSELIHKSLRTQLPTTRKGSTTLAKSWGGRAAGLPSHVEPIQWESRRSGQASIKATLHRQENGVSLGPMPKRTKKGLHIRFEVSTDVPEPFEVHWQVVNTGAEAESAGGLRGGFYRGETHAPRVRWERTQYKGTHWVEAFVVKDSVCVAQAKKYVNIR